MSAKGKGNTTEPTKAPLTNAEILARLQAERVLIPAVGELFNSYRPKVVNRHRYDIQPHFDDMLKRIVPKAEDVEGLDSIDFVLMVSCFFPKADLRELSTLVNCSIWLFLLGGQLRLLHPQKTDYFFTTDDQPGWVAGAKMDPKKVLAYVEQVLGVHGVNSEPTSVKVHTHNVITEIFEEKVSSELKEGCKGQQLDLFLAQLEYFMRQAQEEKEVMIKLTIPTIDEYRAIRRGVPAGVGAVGVLLSLVQYAARLRVHRKVTDFPPVKKLWDEAVEIVWLTIDLHSFHLKEGQDLFLNAVIVYFKETGCSHIQSAVDEVFGILRQSISQFEQLAVELMAERRKHSMSKEEATIIIDGFRNIFVGNYLWMRKKEPPPEEASLLDSSDSD